MTRKVAIEILEELWRYKDTEKYTEQQIRNAITMAIRSLDAWGVVYTKVEEADAEVKARWAPYTRKCLVAVKGALKFIKGDEYNET